MAKPAVPYGGKYGIIDFLSNCVNSGIDTVGVLTQYQPLELNEYIGSGQPWDLDSMNGAGVHVLPPLFRATSGRIGTRGTAKRYFSEYPFIERYHPECVIVLWGITFTRWIIPKCSPTIRKKERIVPFLVIEVPWEEAPRFGILNTNDGGAIYEFDEKPKQPQIQ